MIKETLRVIVFLAIFSSLFYLLYASMQPRGEYKEVATFNSLQEYVNWSDSTGINVPFLHWNWYHNTNAQVTVWSREDWWGTLHYTDTGKNVSGIGRLVDDNDKSE